MCNYINYQKEGTKSLVVNLISPHPRKKDHVNMRCRVVRIEGLMNIVD